MRQASRELWGQPKGLYVLFLASMWNSFSFFGMASLLVLYMNGRLLLPQTAQHVIGLQALRDGLQALYGPMSNQAFASQIFGLYMALTNLTPLIGGAVGDRLFGRRSTIIAGGLMMALGHFLMASEPLFLAALVLLILGTGAFLPNVSAQVADLYAPGDHRGEHAYIVYYGGMNLGAFLSPLVCGSLGELVGWHWGFAAAGVGMALGVAIFMAGARLLPSGRDGPGTGTRRSLNAKDRSQLAVMCAIMAICALFYAVYYQTMNTMPLWARDHADRRLLDWEIPVTWFQSLNPLLIFLFIPILTSFWSRQNRAGREPAPITKMAFGCLLLGASCVVLLGAGLVAGPGQRASWAWLLPYSALLTLGELFLSPVGQSLFTRIAPAGLGSTLLGVWYLSSFFGGYLSGVLGGFWEKLTQPAFWLVLLVVCGAAALLLRMMRKAIDDPMARTSQISGASS